MTAWSKFVKLLSLNHTPNMIRVLQLYAVIIWVERKEIPFIRGCISEKKYLPNTPLLVCINGTFFSHHFRFEIFHFCSIFFSHVKFNRIICYLLDVRIFRAVSFVPSVSGVHPKPLSHSRLRHSKQHRYRPNRDCREVRKKIDKCQSIHTYTRRFIGCV